MRPSARLALVLLAVVQLPSTASALDLTGLYVGGTYGRVRNQLDTNYYDGQLENEAAPDPVSFEARATHRLSHLWEPQVGYFFNEYFGLEVSFIHAGQVNYTADATVPINGTPTAVHTTQHVDSRGPAVSLVGRLPLTSWLDLHARVGDYVARTRLDRYVLVGSTPLVLGFPGQSTASSLLTEVGVGVTLAGHWQFGAGVLRLNKVGTKATGTTFSMNAVTGSFHYLF